MTDRLAEQGAVQYAQNNPVSAGISRLGAAGRLQAAIADALSNGKASLTASRLGGLGRIYALAAGAGPLFLFQNSEVGVWYDPSDLTSMFQDSAGTTAAVVGQPVGLVLDKSQGLVLGPEKVSNGTFDTDTSGWSFTGCTGAVVSGRLRITSTSAGFCFATQIFSGLTPGVQVWAKATGKKISGTTTTAVRVYDDAAGGVPLTAYFCVTGGTSDLLDGAWFTAPADGTVSIRVAIFNAAAAGEVYEFDNISVRELPGYHATQSTSTARPILARHPIGGRRNLLTYTEDFGNAAWNKVGAGTGSVAVVTPNYAAAPDGTMTAARLQLALNGGTTTTDRSLVYQSVSPLTTNPVRSVWIKSNTASSYNVLLEESATGAVTVTPTWQRLSVNVATGATTFDIALRGSLGSSNSADISVWHPQCEDGASATAYQKVTSTYDVTEAGVNDAYYLKFDGVDDFLVSSAINLSSVDHLSIFAGVRKLSDAAQSCVLAVGLNGGSVGVNAELGLLLAPGANAAATYWWRSTGSLTGVAANATGYAAPHTSVLSVQSEIATDLQSIRVNGSTAVLGSGDLGTGNLGSAQTIYIGMRSGSTIPFNGHLYSLVVRGALSDAAQITSAEAFVAGKTGVTL